MIRFGFSVIALIFCSTYLNFVSSLKSSYNEQNVNNIGSDIKMFTTVLDKNGKLRLEPCVDLETESQKQIFRENWLAGVNLTSGRLKPHNKPVDYERRFLAEDEHGRFNMTEITVAEDPDFSEAIVEVLIVCDKELGDHFQQKPWLIKEYFTVYFWDVNVRFKTLPSSNVSFRITKIVIIPSLDQQPFIEDARDYDHKADLAKISELFSKWVYKEREILGHFDVASIYTYADLKEYGSIGWYRGACFMDHDTDSFHGITGVSDDGGWSSMYSISYSYARVLGAPADYLQKYPGGRCKEEGFIMGRVKSSLQWFFSTCSDRTIGQFVRSKFGACLQTTDDSRDPEIGPDYNSQLAPTMDQFCKMYTGKDDAFVSEEDKGECNIIRCKTTKSFGNGFEEFHAWPVDNLECTDGRCFRGRCRRLGKLIASVGTGQCLKAESSFEHSTPIILVDCPRPETGTPLDRFVIGEEFFGNTFATPYNTKDATENADMCITTGKLEGDMLSTEKCDSENYLLGWDMEDVGNKEFLFVNRLTRKCAVVSHGEKGVGTVKRCDKNDPNMKWKLV